MQHIVVELLFVSVKDKVMRHELKIEIGKSELQQFQVLFYLA